jgi:hypothetical protein
MPVSPTSTAESIACSSIACCVRWDTNVDGLSIGRITCGLRSFYRNPMAAAVDGFIWIRAKLWLTRISFTNARAKSRRCWICGTPYDTSVIENRVIAVLHRKVMRYQLQDLRCTKTNRVATRTLAPLSACSAVLTPDISPREAQDEIRLLYSLAAFHELESLKATAMNMLPGV